MTNFNVHFLNMQKDLPTIERDATNPHYKNKYATLENILSTVTPILHKHGFFTSAIQEEINGNEYLLVDIIHAETGDYRRGKVKLVGALDMQKLGSAYTYAYRYGILSALGVAPDMDDDGNNASDKVEKPKPVMVKEGLDPRGDKAVEKKSPPKTIEQTFECIVEFYNANKDKIPQDWIPRVEEHIANKSMPDLQKTYVAIKREVENET